VGIALAITAVLLIIVGANPLEAIRLLWRGSFGSISRTMDTLRVWAPLTLAAAGLVVTFNAGLWNIGVEGQVAIGAVGAAVIARTVDVPTGILVILTMLAAFVAGALWGLVAGVLRTHGAVNEIFGGLGLTFVSFSLITYLVLGPWAREGIASTSGTDPFPKRAWLPTLGDYSVSWLALLIAGGAVVLVYGLLRGTRYGLRVKAVGSNAASARVLGIPTTQYMLSAFALGGGLAGLAGGVLATGTHYKLFPAVSGGFGYLGILIALLAAYRAKWIAPIALFFAAILFGSSQLQLRMSLNPSLGVVIQGVLVLSVMFVGGFRARRRRLAGAAGGPS
jgi:simple sugar transport system permease protein